MLAELRTGGASIAAIAAIPAYPPSQPTAPAAGSGVAARFRKE
jgi:hypothetical protein